MMEPGVHSSVNLVKTGPSDSDGCDKVWKGFEHELYQVAAVLQNVNGELTSRPYVTTICLSQGWSNLR